ncbi:MAG: cyclic nucleotide-binding protein [Rhodobacteraceae bacterium PARR1]|nr:MAG: cyclic nucleotide-binding protein [Rhodobacteraceae bacterium PARR1]
MPPDPVPVFPTTQTYVRYPPAMALANPPPGVVEFRRMAQAQGKPQPTLRHELIVRRGAVSDMIWIVAHGWAVARSDREAGRSAILRLYLPGDIIGLTELGLGLQPHDVEMLTEGLLHAVPRSAIVALARQHLRFWPLLLAMGNAELMLMQNRVILLDRATAEERLLHLLLDLRGRLAVEGVGDGNRFPLPLNQQEIGEATGMTGIYVNRLLGRLVHDGRLEINRPYVRLLDRAWMESRMVFMDLDPSPDPFWAGRG